MWAHGIVEAAVRDHHVGDRLGFGGDGVPDAECVQHAPGRRGDRVGTPVAARVAPQRGVAHDDLERLAEGTLEGERKGQAGETAAGDDDADGRCRWRCHKHHGVGGFLRAG
jgi:hypothetical protein